MRTKRVRLWRRLPAIAAALAVTAVMGAGGTAHAVTVAVPISPEGDGVFTDIASLNWNVGNVLAVDAVPTAEGNQFDVFYQAALATFNPEEAPAFSPDGFEWTIVAGFREVVTGAADTTGDGFNDTATFGLAEDGVNFLQIYFDPEPNHDNLAGTGFNDGILILEAQITDLSGVFNVNTLEDGTPEIALFDQFLEDNHDGQQTVTGEGATDLRAEVTFWNPDFFNLDDEAFAEFAITFFNTSQILPFLQVDPSFLFWDGESFIEPNLGEVNGLDGPDFQFQADANQAFEGVEPPPVDNDIIPEPMTAALGLLGLGALGIASRRRRT